MSKLSKIKKYIVFRYLVIKQVLKHLFTRKKNPIFNFGTHFVEGLSGAGKTLLVNYMLQESTNDNQFFYTNMDQFEKSKQVVIDLNNIFQEGKQIAKLPQIVNGKYCNGLILDEINLNFNRRLNNRRDYNDLFVPLMGMMVTHRHQNLPRIYLMGQAQRLQDTQLMKVIRYKHFVKSRKTYSFNHFLKTQKLSKIPKKIKVMHYVKADFEDVNGEPVYIKYKTSTIKIDYQKHVATYNHLGFAKQFQDLPAIKI